MGDVLAKLKRWWQSRTVAHRQKLRQIDREVLWPTIWDRSGHDAVQFMIAATWHATIDPAWCDASREEIGDVGRWAAANCEELILIAEAAVAHQQALVQSLRKRLEAAEYVGD